MAEVRRFQHIQGLEAGVWPNKVLAVPSEELLAGISRYFLDEDEAAETAAAVSSTDRAK